MARLFSSRIILYIYIYIYISIYIYIYVYNILYLYWELYFNYSYPFVALGNPSVPSVRPRHGPFFKPSMAWPDPTTTLLDQFWPVICQLFTIFSSKSPHGIWHISFSKRRLYIYSIYSIYIVICHKSVCTGIYQLPSSRNDKAHGMISSWTPTTARPWHEVAFFCVLNVFEGLGWGGVGHVNVPCKWHTCWMLRYWRVVVGWGMLTFLVSGTHVGCYVTEGLGWGGAC